MPPHIQMVMGPAGVGKSQLCLTMCACAGLPDTLGGLGEGTGHASIEGFHSILYSRVHGFWRRLTVFPPRDPLMSLFNTNATSPLARLRLICV